MQWLLNSLIFFISVEFIIFAKTEPLKFSCDGRTSGYYADVSTGCQIYHMCDGLGRQFSYTCPNATLFQQRMLICDHWYMVNCSKAESDYSANLRIGQRGMPFVDDDTPHPYHRTPRPDLLRPQSDNDVIYRTGRRQPDSALNLVGADLDERRATAEPAYSPPGRWSAFGAKRPLADAAKAASLPPLPYRKAGGNGRKVARDGPGTPSGAKASFASSFKATTPVYSRLIKASSQSPSLRGVNGPLSDKNKKLMDNGSKVNFASSFKATTPVYPLSVEATSQDPGVIGVKAPLQDERQDLAGNYSQQVGGVNFASNFKATTPVYPLSVEATSQDPGQAGVKAPLVDKKQDFTDKSENEPIAVNFASNFKATTPVYPLSVAATSQDPGAAGVKAPLVDKNQELNDNSEKLTVGVNFASNFKATTPVYPLSVETSSKEAGLFIAPQNGETALLAGESGVRFESSFEATTPVFPKSVEATSQDPGVVGVLPPKKNDSSSAGKGGISVPSLSLEFEAPDFDPNFDAADRNRQKEKVVEKPSIFYRAPFFEPDFTNLAGKSASQQNVIVRRDNENWGDLRKKFFIPDYEFPLESASRPSYDSVLSSFQSDKRSK